MRQVTGEPETSQECKGNAWLQNCVGFCEEPDEFYRSHYLIWALHAEAQLSSMWLRNAREYVQHRSEKQALKTEKSCRLRSVRLRDSEAGRPGKGPVCKCYSDDCFSSW